MRGIMLFIITLLPFYSMAKEIPKSPAGGEALNLRGGKQGYYYADDKDDCFDSLLRDGMTIEFWFCPARFTDPGEWWNLVAKPAYFHHFKPIYQIRIEYSQHLNENAWMQLWRSISSTGGGGSGLGQIIPGKRYEPMWHHIALQGKVAGNGFSGITFIDGVSSPFGHSSSSFVFDSYFPLYVGGLPVETQMHVHIGEDYTTSNVTTFDGLIDELRISDVERYDRKAPGEKINIKERFRPDAHTVALWHFDEEPGLRYEDASGNGHTLFAAGELEVTRKDRIPIVWGELKEQRQP